MTLTEMQIAYILERETGFSPGQLPINQDHKYYKRKEEIASLSSKEQELLFQGIDPKFLDKDLLSHIYQEIDKKHKQDEKEKIAVFIIRTTAELLSPKDRCSAALKGDSSAGKDNLIKTVLDLFPEKDNFFLTRGTQSAIEEEANKVKCIAFSEINKNRDNGANSELTEVFKQLAEGGTNVIKRDQRTHQVINIQSEQKCLMYGTTETESDEELETRYVIISIKGSKEKNKIVVNNTIENYSEASYYIQKKNYDNWISRSINNLDHELEVILPYLPALKNQGIFDLSKERIKRDAKRLFSLTKAIAWLFQKQRQVIQEDGMKFIVSEPCDFITAVHIFSEFFNTTYEGMDHRFLQIYELVKTQQGKHDDKVIAYGYPNDYYGWVVQSDIWKESGLNKETFKKRIKWLKDEGYIESFYDRQVNGKVSLLQVGTQVGTKSVLLGTIPTYNHYFTQYLTPSKIKELYKEKQISYENLFYPSKKRDIYSILPSKNVPSKNQQGMCTNSESLNHQEQIAQNVQEKKQ